MTRARHFPAGRGSIARRVVLPYLHSEGVRRIDRIVVSHSDADHAGGLNDIVDEYWRRRCARRRATAVLHQNRHGPVSAVSAGSGTESNSSSCTRPAGHSFEGNDASCVLQISAGDATLLLTGDIGSSVETRLLQLGLLGNATVVAVPHHGSETSSSPAMVRALAPQLALVANGYRNRWDLPRQDIVDRWTSTGARVASTASHGAIGLRLCAGTGIERLDANRESAGRIWHAAAPG